MTIGELLEKAGCNTDALTDLNQVFDLDKEVKVSVPNEVGALDILSVGMIKNTILLIVGD